MLSSLSSVFNSPLLEPYHEHVWYGFTGKPDSYGGPDTPLNPRALILQHRDQLHAALSQTTGEAIQSWCIPQQVHEATIQPWHEGGQACDAIWLTERNQPAMILTADCVPVLLYHTLTHETVIIHAGWRGTAKQIVLKAATQLSQGHPEHVVAAIGPSIGECCFQVSRDVADQLAQSLGLSLNALSAAPTQPPLIAWDHDTPDNPRLNLKQVNVQQLQSVGIFQIDISPLCTVCQSEQLFSYRRGDSGRQALWAIRRN